MTNIEDYLNSAIKQFKYYKQLSDKCLSVLTFKELSWQYNQQSNSI